MALGLGFSTHAQKGDEALGRTRPGGTNETLQSFLEQILSEHLLYASPLVNNTDKDSHPYVNLLSNECSNGTRGRMERQVKNIIKE